MHKKISLLLLLSTSLVISADHHEMEGDKSKKEMKKMEMMKKKGHMKKEMVQDYFLHIFSYEYWYKNLKKKIIYGGIKIDKQSMFTSYIM